MEDKAHFYHCATKGFAHSILFADIREFIAGMNRIGICIARGRGEFPVILIAFCLMDNHIHVILYGRRCDCLKWMALYHRLTMIWQRKHRQSDPVDEEWDYDAWLIRDEEDLKKKIAYVFRNPTVAGMPFLPLGYRWSSAGLAFSDPTESLANGTPVGGLSIYESRRRFDSRVILPEDWILLPSGLIWPGSYTDYKRVERLFGHPWNFLYYLNQRVEADVNLEMMQGRVSLPDYDILRIAQTIALERFASRDLYSLDIPSRVRLCADLKKKTGASRKQLARILHLQVDDLEELFGREGYSKSSFSMKT